MILYILYFTIVDIGIVVSNSTFFKFSSSVDVIAFTPVLKRASLVVGIISEKLIGILRLG